MDSVLIDTPVEAYEVAGRTVWVKREDLLAPDPAAPNLGKMRGLEKRLRHCKQVGFTKIGAFDTHISVSAWATAYLGVPMGLEVYAFYPQRQVDRDGPLPWRQAEAEKCGATALPIPAGRTGVCWGRARMHMEIVNGYMLPMGLTLPESVEGAMLQTRNVPTEARGGDVVLSAGSGMMTTGVAAGLAMESHMIYGISCGMSPARQRSRAFTVSGLKLPCNVQLILPEGNEYYTPCTVESPFSANRYYDLKAWAWLVANIDSLVDPILFWNIGSDYEER